MSKENNGMESTDESDAGNQPEGLVHATREATNTANAFFKMIVAGGFTAIFVIISIMCLADAKHQADAVLMIFFTIGMAFATRRYYRMACKDNKTINSN